MINFNDGTIGYLADFRAEIDSENLRSLNSQYETIQALVNALNDNLDLYQADMVSAIRGRISELISRTFSNQNSQLKPSVSSVQVTDLHFDNGSLIIIGTIFIVINLGNYTFKTFLLQTAGNLLAKWAGTSILRGINTILSKLGWEIRRVSDVNVSVTGVPISSLPQPKTKSAIMPASTNPSSVPTNPSIALVSLTTISVILLILILVAILVIGFMGHIL